MNAEVQDWMEKCFGPAPVRGRPSTGSVSTASGEEGGEKMAVALQGEDLAASEAQSVAAIEESVSQTDSLEDWMHQSQTRIKVEPLECHAQELKEEKRPQGTEQWEENRSASSVASPPDAGVPEAEVVEKCESDDVSERNESEATEGNESEATERNELEAAEGNGLEASEMNESSEAVACPPKKRPRSAGEVAQAQRVACRKCGLELCASESEKSGHVWTGHCGAERPWQCETCGFGSEDVNAVEAHLAATAHSHVLFNQHAKDRFRLVYRECFEQALGSFWASNFWAPRRGSQV